MAGIIGAVCGSIVLSCALWIVERRQKQGFKPLRPIAATTHALGLPLFAAFAVSVLGLPIPDWAMFLVMLLLAGFGWWVGLRVADRVYADRELAAQKRVASTWDDAELKSLEDLAGLELWCAVEMYESHKINPFMTIDDRTPRREPVIAEWQQIHSAYLRLAAVGSGPDAREALKRALFIQWYEVAEPFFNTGILDLDADVKRGVLNLVEAALSDDADRELREMVAWYWQICDWAFDKKYTGPGFRSWGSKKSDLAWLKSEAQDSTYLGRGEMGDYFHSLNKPK